jgi:hypothetical protein
MHGKSIPTLVGMLKIFSNLNLKFISGVRTLQEVAAGGGWEHGLSCLR